MARFCKITVGFKQPAILAKKQPFRCKIEAIATFVGHLIYPIKYTSILKTHINKN